MSAGPDGAVVLVGARPAEPRALLARLGVPYLWLVDPAEPLPVPEGDVLGTVVVPYREDPASVLRVPLPSRVSGVLSFTELGSLPAALLAESLGLPTVSAEAVRAARDKQVMRRLLAGAGGGPAFGVVGADEPAAADFPLIAKPADGSGSKGVEYLPTAADYRRRSAELAGLLWEQVLGGEEFSVETVSAAGEHRVLGVTAKLTTGRPYYVETGHRAPAALTTADRAEVERCVRQCLDALGVRVGAGHTEVKLDRGRATVIETHTRAGGDRIPLLTRLVGGEDQFALALRAVMPWIPAKAVEPVFACAAVHYLGWQDAVLTAVDGLEECRALPGVVEAEITARPGERIPVWRYSHVRPGYVVVGADDPRQLAERIGRAEAALRPRFG